LAFPKLQAVVIQPVGITVSTPSGSNNAAGAGTAGNPYTDDIFLESLVLSSGGGAGSTTTLSAASESFIVGVEAIVRSGASSVNAEFGDNDTGSDGNANPFVSAGIINEGDPLTDATRESTDPNIQNPSISAAINSLSLSQGVDGEGPDYTLDIFFAFGVLDNDSGIDSIPELIIFERGVNSSVALQAITGGSTASPTFAPITVSIDAADFFATGIHVDTIEIGGSQELGVAGVDLNDFGAGTTPILGVRILSTGGTGADIPSVITTTLNSSQITPPIPEPSTTLLSLLALFFIQSIRRR